MTPEGKVKAEVKRLLTEAGAWFCMPVGGQFGKAGVPDFLCLLNGVFFSVETKAKGGKTTKLQDMEMAKIRAAGGFALVTHPGNIEELEEFLRTTKGQTDG